MASSPESHHPAIKRKNFERFSSRIGQNVNMLEAADANAKALLGADLRRRPTGIGHPSLPSG